MPVVTMPAAGIVTVKWSMTPAAQVTRSDWTGKTRILRQGVPRWQAAVDLVPGSVAALQAWNAFFAQCDGPANTFALAATETAQCAAVTATATAGAMGTAIPLTGLPASTTVLPAGALVHIASSAADQQMFRLTAALISDGSGAATATINPGTVFATVSGSVATLARPSAMMRLTAGTPNGWSVSPGAIYTPMAFTCEEFF